MSIDRRKFLLGTGIGLAGVAVGGAIGARMASGRGWRFPSDVPRVLQIATSEVLPAEADVVVIGGGIAGISTALSLNERGLRTVVLEKGVDAGHTRLIDAPKLSRVILPAVSRTTRGFSVVTR